MGKRPKRISPKEQLAVASVAEEEFDLPCSFQSPESSTIRSAVYDPETLTLFVTFVHDDSTYRYDGISHEVWKGFLCATSRGTYFARALRPMYAGKRV